MMHTSRFLLLLASTADTIPDVVWSRKWFIEEVRVQLDAFGSAAQPSLLAERVNMFDKLRPHADESVVSSLRGGGQAGNDLRMRACSGGMGIRSADCAAGLAGGVG